jgi:hypothetical protein
MRTTRTLGSLLLGLLLISACSRSAAPAAPPPATATPEPTATLIPTATSAPTATAIPTATPALDALAPTPTTPPENTPNETQAAALFFLEYTEQQTAIKRLGSDGNITPIAENLGTMIDFVVSPADSSLAILAYNNTDFQIYRTGPAGENPTIIANGLLRSIVFDPTGELLLFAVDLSDGQAGSTTLTPGIWSIPAAGGEPTQILANREPETASDGQITPGINYAPVAYAPDGQRLLVITSPNFGPDTPAGDIGVVGLSILEADGTLRELLEPGGDDPICVLAVWAADGNEILCSSTFPLGPETPALFSINPENGETKALIANQSGNASISVANFRRDGETTSVVVITSTDPASSPTVTIEQYTNDAEQRQVLTELPGRPDNSIVVWSPDGTTLFYSGNFEQPGLYRQVLPNGESSRLTDLPIGRLRFGT